MVVSFSKLGNHGRIGNQLNQIAATLGIAETNNAQASFPPWQYEKYFASLLPHHGLASYQHKEKNFHYEPLGLASDTDLFGYFLSYKYFPKDYKPKFAPFILDQWKNHNVFDKETIAIHIRRGDYVGHDLYYQIPITWYISALLSIPNWKDCNIIFCSDDLEYCRVHFECLENAFFIKGFEIDHLVLMSLADHHIVGNSTYGWWGAYLSEQKDVKHSGKMFRGEWRDKIITDFYPPNWKEHTEEKLDLTDVTFTIPVLWDSPDRKQNVDLGLCVLLKDFNTNIIIGEQGKEPKFEYVSKWTKYHYFEMEEFHRTKMLNEMALMSETSIIANWDADIFIPPMQLWDTVERLRAGADCVYPYDGRFARMERNQWFRHMEKQQDIGLVGKFPLDHRNIRESVGGAVFWRKESFIDFGMENEYMVSYAPEDVERWERVHKFRLNFQRVGGTLYHMNHFKGIDSNNRNPNFPNSKKELEKERAMSADQLRHYVDSWPWRHKYTDAYYNRISSGAIKSAQETYPTILALLWPGRYTNDGLMGSRRLNEISVIDVGCGVGEWSLGNPNYMGLDYGVPEKSLTIPKENYINYDLDKLLSDRPTKWPIPKQFDLCLCLEVAEHISQEMAGALVDYLCDTSDNILFSAAIPNQGGTGHINEQWQEYWAEKFYNNGFGALSCYPVKNKQETEMWYRQNAVLYKRGASGKVTNFVLPEYYMQITNYLKNR